MSEIIIPFLNLANTTSSENYPTNSAYLKIVTNDKLFEGKHDFIKLLTLRTYDIIITSKDTEDGELKRLKEFEKRFKSRTFYISFFVYQLLLISFLAGTIYLFKLNPKVEEIVGNIEAIVGILGLSLGNIFPIFRKKIHLLIMTLLGSNLTKVSLATNK